MLQPYIQSATALSDYEPDTNFCYETKARKSDVRFQIRWSIQGSRISRKLSGSLYWWVELCANCIYTTALDDYLIAFTPMLLNPPY